MAEVKSGYMHKCGKLVKNWKKRWFILKPNGYLHYYEGPGKGEKGKIDIIDAIRIAPWQEVGTAERKLPAKFTGENSFAIVSGDRTYTCCCENDGESLSWMAAIEKVRGAASSQDQHHPPPTFREEAQVKTVDPLTSNPPPYTPITPEEKVPPSSSPCSYSGPPPQHAASPSVPPMPSSYNAQPNGPPPPQSSPYPAMPDPTCYGDILPNASPNGYHGNPAAGPGYQGMYNYQSRPCPQYQPPPPPMYYNYAPPPHPAYPSYPPPLQPYPQRPPPPWSSPQGPLPHQPYPQGPFPPQVYLQGPPPLQPYPQRLPQPYYRPPVVQQQTSQVTAINLEAPSVQRVLYH